MRRFPTVCYDCHDGKGVVSRLERHLYPAGYRCRRRPPSAKLITANVALFVVKVKIIFRINYKMFNFDWGLRWLPRRFRTLKKICAALPVRTYHPARLFHFRSGSMPFHMPRPGKSVPVPGLGLCHCFRVSTV